MHRKGEVQEVLPGSESRASETQIYQAYQGEPVRPRHGGYGGTRYESQGSQTCNECERASAPVHMQFTPIGQAHRQSESLVVPMKHINKYVKGRGGHIINFSRATLEMCTGDTLLEGGKQC